MRENKYVQNKNTYSPFFTADLMRSDICLFFNILNNTLSISQIIAQNVVQYNLSWTYWLHSLNIHAILPLRFKFKNIYNLYSG